MYKIVLLLLALVAFSPAQTVSGIRGSSSPVVETTDFQVNIDLMLLNIYPNSTQDMMLEVFIFMKLGATQFEEPELGNGEGNWVSDPENYFQITPNIFPSEFILIANQGTAWQYTLANGSHTNTFGNFFTIHYRATPWIWVGHNLNISKFLVPESLSWKVISIGVVGRYFSDEIHTNMRYFSYFQDLLIN